MKRVKKKFCEKKSGSPSLEKTRGTKKEYNISNKPGFGVLLANAEKEYAEDSSMISGFDK